MFRLAIKMLRKDLKASLFYLLVMILTIAIHFSFTCSSGANLMAASQIDVSGASGIWASLITKLNSGISLEGKILPPIDYLNGVIVFFCCFLMFYMNKNYTFNKRKEIAILSVSGATFFQIILFLSILLLLSFIPGLLVGYGSVNLLFRFISNMTNTPVASIDSQNLMEAIILISVIFIYLVFYIICYVFNLDIKELLATRNNNKVINEAPVRKKADYFFIFMYVGGVIAILIPLLPYKLLSITLFFILMGLYGTVNGSISNLIFKWKENNMFNNRYLVISISNYSSTLLTNKVTIISMIFSIIIMFFIAISCAGVFSNFVLSIIGYVIAIVLLSFTVTFDLITQAKQRTVYYVNLWKIGYTRKELVKIIRQEMFMIYSTIIVFTLLVNGSIGFRYALAGALDFTIYFLMIGFYVLIVLLTAIMTYFVYKNTINSSIVEEK